MQLSEVLSQVDGLNKRFVYYLEALAYIQPARVRKSRIDRRDYSQTDLERIRDIWAYYRRGYSIPTAREMVEQPERSMAFLLLSSPTGRWPDAMAMLKANLRVQEVAFVYGESANIIVRVTAPDDTEALSVLNEVFDRGDLVGAPSVLRIRSSVTKKTEKSETGSNHQQEAGLQAYLLIKVPAKHAGGVLDTLRDIDGVAEASVVYGETDIVARVVAPDQEAFDDLVIGQIQCIAAVESTRTFIVVGRMHWRRATTSALGNDQVATNSPQAR